MLAIEIDGATHNFESAYLRDTERQDRLESLGVRVIRFIDEEVRQNLDGVLQGIRNWMDENAI